ncbi:protein-disulfide reductase DsbD [Acinetobacter schindleri]|uniref:Protein-disulfide reductase DsbD n=1 Tax=Acinetobacter schindleri TaxID=108981 RepID=A0AAE7BXX7_9GAMM|nr:protein-disulfide reductase DsbD [Acinetobacter schindleri]QIC67738.1 protein-disulfide reductase DsbD [Acinetobacter schindleri]
MLKWILGAVIGGGIMTGTAHADFLPPDQAFQFQVVSTSQGQAELSWKIAEGYYLYHDQLKVSSQQTLVKLTLPKPEDKDDPNFGLTQVHYGQVKTNLNVQPNQQSVVQWQGCAESGLCYPVQRTTIKTDADGLFPAHNLSKTPKLLASTAQPEANDKILTARKDKLEAIGQAPSTDQALTEEKVEEIQVAAVSEPVVQPEMELTEKNDQLIADPKNQTSSAGMNGQWNNDQYFLSLLSEQGLLINALIFLGLGILLAFLPCSLPLIPILTGILVQQHRSYRAALIALVFVLGMALVYAVMGLAVAQLGYSFQRWFQSPIFISIFSILFVLFALNLFGAFQLSLPQGMLQRLDQWQQKRKSGTLIGAGLMGMIAALIVGPCMSAPLAGALIYVSQLNQPMLGAGYLFVLGLGLGLPLFIAAVFGSHLLPKPGIWMDRLKFSFGFVMLALALYFARPLLPGILYLSLLGVVLITCSGYFLFKMLPHVHRSVSKIVLMLLSGLLVYAGGMQLYHVWSQVQVAHVESRLEWQKVSTAAQLQQLLAKHREQPVVIDVYADWCVACQPIEKEVISRSDVQAALQNVVRIKLDLTHYHPSQDELLKEWQILGPPTFIFLNAAHQEQRELRLTGSFSAAHLLDTLQQLQGEQP